MDKLDLTFLIEHYKLNKKKIIVFLFQLQNKKIKYTERTILLFFLSSHSEIFLCGSYGNSFGSRHTKILHLIFSKICSTRMDRKYNSVNLGDTFNTSIT